MTTGGGGSRGRGAGWTAVLAATGVAMALLTLGAAPAIGKERKPPKTFDGSYTGVNYHPPEVGLVTRWSGSVNFKLFDSDRRKKIYNYIGTGSVTFTFSGGAGCSYTGTQTLPTSGDDAALTILKKRSGWKYFLEIGTTAESITAQVHCPGQADETQDYFPPYPLMTGRKARRLSGLGSISGNFNEANSYLTNWNLS